MQTCQCPVSVHNTEGPECRGTCPRRRDGREIPQHHQNFFADPDARLRRDRVKQTHREQRLRQDRRDSSLQSKGCVRLSAG